MVDHPHLTQSPIIEALLDFQASAAEHWGKDDVLTRTRELFPAHSDVQTMREFNVEMAGAEPEPSVTASAPVRGYMLRAPAQPTVHQVRRDGYAFSRLKSYEDWDAFIAAAFTGWEVYQKAFAPGELHRITVRFINRLEFPLTEFQKDRKKYLTIAPQVPPGLGWSFFKFSQNYAYTVPDSALLVNINLFRLVEPGVKETSSIILDIEIAIRESLAALGRSAEELLPEMRSLKNEAFFRILTPEAIAPYL